MKCTLQRYQDAKDVHSDYTVLMNDI